MVAVTVLLFCYWTATHKKEQFNAKHSTKILLNCAAILHNHVITVTRQQLPHNASEKLNIRLTLTDILNN